ncbi:MAG: hypothetical protein R3B07_37845 [Polyangiaceae bacterium]
MSPKAKAQTTKAPRFLLGALALFVVAEACSPARPAKSGPSKGAPELASVSLPPGVVLERVCVPSGPELCFNAIDDNCNGVLDEGCGLHTGLVQFTIAWSEADADVDLEVTDPSGELVEVGRVSEDGLVKERDCPGSRNECLGQNIENVFLDQGEPARGEYSVVIRVEKLGTSQPPLEVTLGARVGPKTFATRIRFKADDEQQKLVFEL